MTLYAVDAAKALGQPTVKSPRDPRHSSSLNLQVASGFPPAQVRWRWLGWVGLGWVGLGWVGLGWVGLGWVGLGWVGLGWVGLGWVGLGWVGLCVCGKGGGERGVWFGVGLGFGFGVGVVVRTLC